MQSTKTCGVRLKRRSLALVDAVWVYEARRRQYKLTPTPQWKKNLTQAKRRVVELSRDVHMYGQQFAALHLKEMSK